MKSAKKSSSCICGKKLDRRESTPCSVCVSVGRMMTPQSVRIAERLQCNWSCQKCGIRKPFRNMMHTGHVWFFDRKGRRCTNGRALSDVCIACQNKMKTKNATCVACGKNSSELTSEIMSCSVKETSLQVCSCSSCAKLIETEGIPFILEKQQARFKENERDVLNRKEKAVTLEKTVERREVPQKGNTMSEILMAQILANEKLVEKVSELQDLLVLAAAREDELQEKMRQLQEEVESARHELREKTAELEEKMEQDKKKEEEKVPPEISRMLENLASRYAEVMGSPMPV